MKRRNIFRFIIASLIILTHLVSAAVAADQESIIASAENVSSIWEKELSRGLDIVWFHPGDQYWSVSRYTLVSGSPSFDVKRTDSIISPYNLILTFTAYHQDNINSPNANGIIKSVKRRGGFNTAEDALRNVSTGDFGKKLPYKMRVLYSLQRDVWILKGGNDDFNLFIGTKISDKENSRSYGHLLSVAIPNQGRQN